MRGRVRGPSRSGPGRNRRSPVGRSAGAPPPDPPEIPLVKVDVEASPSDHWLREVTQRWPVRVRMDVCRAMGSGSPALLQALELTGDPGDLGEVERYLRGRSDLRGLTVLAPSPTRRFVRAVSSLPASCRRIFEVGAICATCRFAFSTPTDGKARWTLVIPRTAEALRAVASAQSEPRESPAPILRMRRFVPDRTLTAKQSTALETAYRLGFYAVPRRTNLREISRLLGVSRSSTGELLRRAERKMLAHEIGGG